MRNDKASVIPWAEVGRQNYFCEIIGIGERTTKEVHNLGPSTMKIKVVASLERKYSAWSSILPEFPVHIQKPSGLEEHKNRPQIVCAVEGQQFPAISLRHAGP